MAREACSHLLSGTTIMQQLHGSPIHMTSGAVINGPTTRSVQHMHIHQLGRRHHHVLVEIVHDP